LEQCKQLNDVPLAMEKIEKLIALEPAQKERILWSATQFFRAVEQNGFLKSLEEVISEELILVKDEMAKRPDKIFLGKDKIRVVDFKTGARSFDHQRQLNLYENVLSSMYENKPVECWLYYSNEGILERVGI
jgi:ATP-dependent exoDNAse (exonuclease V) beta subunit